MSESAWILFRKLSLVTTGHCLTCVLLLPFRMSRSLLPLRTRCELALAASNGLAYLHELHIVHFDLKPDNLLLDALPAVVRAAAGADQEEPIAIRIGQAAAAVETPYQDYKNSSSNGGAVVAAGSGAGSMHSPTDRRVRLARSSSGRSSVALEIAEVPVVKVADFGLSKHKLNSTYVSSCRDLRGTLPYMAPELVADPERVSEKADVWSLGVVMWEMLTREIPFQVGVLLCCRAAELSSECFDRTCLLWSRVASICLSTNALC